MEKSALSTKSILLVEDEREIADTLVYALNSEGFQAHWVNCCADALTSLSESPPSFAIFDVGLPDGSGFELLKTIRLAGHDFPVLFLTARGEEIDRIIGLEIGADDYVVKPFSPREVVTRVKVILKRWQPSTKPTTASAKQPSSDFEHSPAQRLIRYRQQALDLTRAEYELLQAFLGQPGRVFSRRQLIEQIWSSNHPSDDRAIDTHIKTLRAKLKPLNPHKDFIVTHRGVGYSLAV